MENMSEPAETESNLPSTFLGNLPAMLVEANDPAWTNRAKFAWDEFFGGEIVNEHTRSAYIGAVTRFLKWCEEAGVRLQQITPGHVGHYISQLDKATPTKKLALAAIRHCFDTLVHRHVLVLNPAHSVRAERYSVVEGKTPEIGVEGARQLIRSIGSVDVVALRDRAVIAVLIYTAVRVSAVTKLRLRDFRQDGTQYTLRFSEKGGKSREIPVRHDLEQFLNEYLAAVCMDAEEKDAPFFRSVAGRMKKLTERGLTAEDACRMVKRRLKDAGLPSHLSPHSFRVTAITDLLNQGVPLEDVQCLAGHADPRTTRLYDRRQRAVTRNVVERISI
jgi:integrase/recombinase XerD